ncbi:DNA repair protein RecO [Candidatus Roizmanbacteria bacterium]|nr:DNA repair protein RecO [Candidatus Roizmanbacteria bacterium]
MSQILKTEAIVLKKKNLLGKDVLITLLSEEEGKIAVFAKGIKKITSRRAPHVQTANLITTIISSNNSRYYLQESKLVSAFSGIKSEPRKIDILYLVFFVLDRMLPELQREQQLYISVKKFLIELAKTKEFSKIQAAYYLQEIVHLLGYHKKIGTWVELIGYIEEIIHEKLPSRVI